MAKSSKIVIPTNREDPKLDVDLNLLQKLRRAGKYCDVNLQSTVRDNKAIIPCHKIVLFTASPFFQKELEKDDRSSFNFDKIGHETLEALIDYIYSGGRISLSSENIWNVSDGAQEWGLHKLQVKCERFLRGLISVESVLLILHRSRQRSYQKLVNDCVRFILENLKEVKSIHFYSMSASSIKLLIQYQIKHGFPSPKVVLETVSEWLHLGGEGRKRCAFDLIKDIPLSKIRIEDLQRILKDDELMKSIPEVYALYVKVLEDSLTSLKKKVETLDSKRPSSVLSTPNSVTGNQLQRFSLKPEGASGSSKRLCLPPQKISQGRTSFQHNNCFEETRAGFGKAAVKIKREAGEVKNAFMYFITKSGSSFKESFLCSYNLESKELCKLGKIPYNEKRGLWLGYHDGRIYNIVWRQHQVRAFNVKERDWNYLALFLPNKFIHFNSIFQGDFIYQIGGVLDSSVTSEARRMNLTCGVSGNWDDIEKMKHPRCKAGVVVAVGNIYVASAKYILSDVQMGGYDLMPYSLAVGVKEVECYDPFLNKWSTKREMPKWRGGFAIATVGACIYVMGGDYTSRYRNPLRSNRTMLNIVEVYDTQKDQWQSGVPMKRKRMRFSAIVHNNFIYAIGGDNDDYYPGTKETIERYDVNKQIWEDLGPLPPDGIYSSVTFNISDD